MAKSLTPLEVEQIISGTWRYRQAVSEEALKVRREAMAKHEARFSKLEQFKALSKQRREEVVSVFRQTCLGWRTPIGHSVNGKVDQAVTRLCAQAAKGWK
jgi:hypothetical protein